METSLDQPLFVYDKDKWETLYTLWGNYRVFRLNSRKQM